MNESHKYSESERCVVYKQTDGYMELSMIFNKEIKTVDICMSMFVKNDEPMINPTGSSAVNLPAKCGHMQSIYPTLSIEDVEFLYKKTNELFG